jgi:hypothetical protein
MILFKSLILFSDAWPSMRTIDPAAPTAVSSHGERILKAAFGLTADLSMELRRHGSNSVHSTSNKPCLPGIASQTHSISRQPYHDL